MKRKYYLFVLLFLMGLGSCKDFLTPAPTDFQDPAKYYDTEAQLQYAKAGVYSILGTKNFYGNNVLYFFGWSADEGYVFRNNFPIAPYTYSYSTADAYNLQLWSILYSGINRANVLLANIDHNPQISQAKRDAIRGEMLFLRGFYYFTLAQYYGGVPLKLTPTSSIIDVNVARSSLKETYAQILSDMEAAEPLVPGIASLGYGGAVSKSAVRGILARVNLTMAGEPLKDLSRYAEASKWAKKVIDDTEAGHALNPSYPQIFMNLAGDKYDTKESIWEVEFYGNGLDQYVEMGGNGWVNGPLSGTANVNTGRADAYMAVTSKLYNIFEPGDNRKWFSIAHFTYAASGPNGTKNLTVLPATDAAKTQMRPAKFRREYETLLPKNASATPENVPLLRYSDVLLMYAEAENAINGGPTPAAIDAVNKVRRRAWSTGVKAIAITNGGTGYTTIPTVTITGGGGSGATATAAKPVGGKITSIILDRDPAGIKFYQEGDNYTSAPTVTITGGGGTGAVATASIYSVNDANLTAAQTATKESFLALIQDERMREFNCENLRKADLLRWGIFLKVCQDMGNQLQMETPGAYQVKWYSNVSAKDVLMPIPATETITNRAMEQNPGWN